MLRRLKRVAFLFGAMFFVVCVVVWWLEKDVPETQIASLGHSIWFCICTISTVGYGDIYPVTAAGKTVTGIFILFTLIAIGFLLTAINEAVIEVKKMEETGLIGTSFSGHIIVCGWSSVARTAVEELLAAGQEVAIICDRPEDLNLAQRFRSNSSVFVTTGELSQEILRDRLNAGLAHTAVVATTEDTTNIIAALNLRAVNSSIRIIVAVKTEALRQTLIASGVTYVASPYELSGRLVASAAFEPEIAQFVDDITSGVDGFDLQQYSAKPFEGLEIQQLRAKLADIDGPLLIGIARWSIKKSKFEIMPYPPKNLTISAKDHLIVVANKSHTQSMLETFGIRQGR